VPDRDTLLRIYLNDHLAGSTAGLALAKRALRSNPDGELGDFLRRLVAEIAEDRETLLRVMDAVGARRNPVKARGAQLLELAGRLKLNGRLTGYSDLSRLLELEGLVIGIEGKRGLWDALRESGLVLPVDLEALSARAAAQRDGAELHRRAAARRAFGTNG
jgi:hypothetical protein